MRRARFILTLGLALLIGCAGANWQPLTVPRSAPLDEKTIVEFHAGEKVVRLHGVRFTADSVSGIPWLDHLTCASCRTSYPLAGVTGVRTGNPGAGAWAIGTPIFIVTGAGLLLAVLLTLFPCHCD